MNDLTKTPTPSCRRRSLADLRVVQLQDQLAKRARFDVLVFILGALIGVILWTIITGPPVDWFEICQQIDAGVNLP